MLTNCSSDANQGRAAALAQLQQMRYSKLPNAGAITQFSIPPLIESQAAGDGLKTENGVAYLIRADDHTTLFDVGFNEKGAHPLPLLHNMVQLGIRPDEIDLLALSHLHPDHLDGARKKPFISKMKTPRNVTIIPTSRSRI